MPAFDIRPGQGVARPGRLALFAGIAVALIVTGLASASLWQERQAKLARVQRDLANLGHALAEHVALTLETIDLSLAAGLRQLRDLHGSSGAPEHNQRALRAHADALPAVSAIALYGPDGARRAASSPDASDLPLALDDGDLLAVRSGRREGLIVSARRSGPRRAWQLLLLREVTGADDDFRGVIAAALDPRRLAEPYGAINLGASGSVALVSAQGVVLASYPWRDELIGERHGGFAAASELSATTLAFLSPFSGQLAVGAAIPIRGYPLVLGLAVDERAVLAPWRRQALVVGSAAVLIGTLAAAFGALLDRHRRRREESVRRMRENQAELTEAHRIAQLGRFSVDAATGTMQWSTEAARLLGAPSVMSSTIEQLIEHVVKADRKLLRRAWSSLLAGASGDDIEFRIEPEPGDIRWLRARAEVLPACAGESLHARGTLIDITARRESELRRSVEHRIAQLLAQSAPLSKTMPQILKSLGRTFGFECALQWELDPAAQHLQRVSSWSRGTPAARELIAAVESRVGMAASGALVQAWRAAAPLAIAQPAADPRYAGLRCDSRVAHVLLVPITLEARAIALIELLGARPMRSDTELISTARIVGSQIGQYIERRKAEDALRKEKEYIGHVLACAPSLIACIAADGTIGSVNAAIRDIAGLAPEELQGRDFWSTLVAPGDRARIGGILETARTLGVTDGEIAIRTARGERRDLAVDIAARHAPDGAVAEYILVGTDVTERKRIDAAQKQSDARLRRIAANIPGIVFEYRLRPDHTASFEYLSDRTFDVLEESPQALMRDPRRIFEMVDPAYRRRLLRSMRASRDDLTLWTFELPIRTRSGRVKWVRGQSNPKPLEDGSVTWDGVIVDVSAQKHVEQAIQTLNEHLERRVAERTAELSAANRELESFSYSVSHDLRAPLRSIDGFSRILLEDHAERLDRVAVGHLTRVRGAAQRMGQLIDDLLSLSRATRGELKRVRTDLSAIAEAIMAELISESPRREFELRIEPGVICFADPNLMRIALYNLLGNAWKFTSRRSRSVIELGTLLNGEKTVYYVRDNGAGFDMKFAGKLFGAFQRVHSSREFDGTGIGLATVSRIIDRHGGAIWAQAEVDQGATFYFTLTATEQR